MNKAKDITRLPPFERNEVIIKKYASNSDQFALAAAGLELIRQRENSSGKTRNRQAQQRFAVERRIVVEINGETIEIFQYLSDSFVPGGAERAWGSPDHLKVFLSREAAKRSALLKEDPDIRVVPLSQVVVSGEMLSRLKRGSL